MNHKQSNTSDASTNDAMLIVGVDWANDKHDLAVIDPAAENGMRVDFLQSKSGPEAIEETISQLQKKAAGRRITVCLEKGRVGILYQLMHREDFVIYPVDPKQVARYRESFTSSKAKDDRGDAMYLARFLQERMKDLNPLRDDDPLTNRLKWFSEQRRSFVNEKTRLIQQLTSRVKLFHPLVLELSSKVNSSRSLDFLRRFTDPRKAKKTHQETLKKFFQRHGVKNSERVDELVDKVRSTPLVTRDAAIIDSSVIFVRTLVQQLLSLEKAIEECEQEILVAMNQHPDAKLFRTLPGAGEALSPRLLTLYGSDRERYQDAEEVACCAGIAPVTKQSGKKRVVSRRRACSKFLLQTFHEFARSASMYCPWSRAYYRWQRDKGVGHHAAIRKLATRWNRILFRVWKTRTPYNPDHYLNIMKQQNHPLVNFLETA